MRETKKILLAILANILLPTDQKGILDKAKEETNDDEKQKCKQDNEKEAKVILLYQKSNINPFKIVHKQ